MLRDGIILTTIGVVVMAIFIAYLISEISSLGIIPSYLASYFYASVWVIIVIAITYLISRYIKNKVAIRIGEASAGNISFVITLFGYIIAFIGLLVFARVGLGSALAAGGFTGLVFGLAVQDVLSNVFGGIMIIIARPYKIGDVITISTWQYGLIAPSYPPKFFSKDFIVPGYTGIVRDISLLYTTIYTKENIPIKIPNSAMIQAAIFIHNREENRVVRTKYEVKKSVDPAKISEAIKRKILKFDFVVKEPTVRIEDTTLDTYVLVIDTICRHISEEEARDKILREIIKIAEKMQQNVQSK